MFVVWPTLLGLRLAFFQWNLLAPEKWVWLQNFAMMFADPKFWPALGNSLRLVILGSVLQTVIAFILALTIMRIKRGATVYRFILYVPMTMSVVAIGLIWAQIYDPQYGLLNTVLKSIGFGSLARVWLGDPNTALGALLFVSLWRWTGFNVVIYVASLQTVPAELYDAARVDGASAFRQLISITIPMIAPFTFLQVVINMLGYLRFFDLVFVTTKGGPADSTEVLPIYIYQHAFQYFDIGIGAAGTVVSLVIAVAITLLFVVVSRYVRGISYRGTEQ